MEGVGVASVEEVRLIEHDGIPHTYFVQLMTGILPKMWPSSMRPMELGALPISARPEVNLRPRRCRITGSRFSQAVLYVVTSLVTSLFSQL